MGEAKARKMQATLLALRMWPKGAIALTLPKLVRGGEQAVHALVVEVVADKYGFHGLAEADAAVKARIVDLVLATPLDTPKHGSTQFSAVLQAEALAISNDTAGESPLRRWWGVGAFLISLMKSGSTSRYVTYIATKGKA